MGTRLDHYWIPAEPDVRRHRAAGQVSRARRPASKMPAEVDAYAISHMIAGSATVYIITHVPTGRHYVGASYDVSNRLRGHIFAARGSGKWTGDLHRAMRDHGTETFCVTIVGTWPAVEAEQIETWWIEFLEATKPEHGFNKRCDGYNVARKGSR